MKYLKRFNESIDSDIISNIKDILVDLQDKGIDVEILKQPISGRDGLNILISDPNNLNHIGHAFRVGDKPLRHSFDICSDTWDSLYRLYDYLVSEGYVLRDISFRARDSKSGSNSDGANSLDEFKRIVEVFGYHSFAYIILKYRQKNLRLEV